MVSEPACNFLRGEVSKLAPITSPLQREAPRTGEHFLLELLRPLEERLIARALLPNCKSLNFHPLWFIAETERNIFLWRRGQSLADASLYEFWVEPQKLIDKRIKQIGRGDSLRRLTSSLDDPASSNALGRPSCVVEAGEIEYLAALEARITGVAAHLEGLSHFSCSLRTLNHTEQQQKIVLPASVL